MDDIIKNYPMSISVIDYIGKMDNGVGILLNLTVLDESYELGFWFNREGQAILSPEPRLLDTLNVSDIKKYDKVDTLVSFILHSLPDNDKILDEFGV